MKSFWAEQSWIFDEPPANYGITFLHPFSWNYGTSFVLSFWHKTPDYFVNSGIWYKLVSIYPKD
jgi:hypothetical protein